MRIFEESGFKLKELIIKDEYDFILCYNANYDDVHHKKGVESVEAQESEVESVEADSSDSDVE